MSHFGDIFKALFSLLLGLFSSFLFISAFDDSVVYLGNRIVDAINCGGKQHTDIHGISYRGDPLSGTIGISSDYGSRMIIGRVPPQDMILYQTERYHSDDFSYEFKMSPDKKDQGDYVLVLKFSEVYFQSTGQKVFNAFLNDRHRIVTDLDIFAQAGGHGIAHDEVIPFSINNGQLRVFDEVSDFSGKLKITFVKGEWDNPKINAFYIFRGKVEEIPEMPSLGRPDEDENELEMEHEIIESEQEEDRRGKLASGPKAKDPYADQDGSQMFLPILITLACFFPVLFCLCKL